MERGGEMRRLLKAVTLAVIGGVIYYGIEAAYKGLFGGGRMHWSMGVVGGVMFLAIGAINEIVPRCMPFIRQAILGAALITGVELAAGVILNLWLRLGVWDYSALPLNLMGQICMPFSLAWVALSAAAIILDDWLRFRLWGEPRPHYQFWRCTGGRRAK